MTATGVLSADVVVIGAGSAGSLLADRLAQAGVAVVILEAGPRIDRASAVVNFLASPTKTPNSPYPPNSIAFQPDSGDDSNYVINDGADRFHALYLRGVGGTTWHMGGTAMRYRPSDFRTRSLFSGSASIGQFPMTISSHGTARPSGKPASRAMARLIGARRGNRAIPCPRSPRPTSIRWWRTYC